MVVALLDRQDKPNLRLTCKALQAFVERQVRQLTISAVGPFTAVPSRLPNVHSLSLRGQDEGLGSPDTDFVGLMSGKAWSSVDHLHLDNISCVAAAAAATACPNLWECSIGKLSASAQGVADFLRVACRSLRNLTSLVISDHSLDDAAVHALGACATLRHLEVQLGLQVTPNAWTSFLALPLTSLSVTLPSTIVSTGALSCWASGMAGLTSLTVQANMPDPQATALRLMLPTALDNLSLTLRPHDEVAAWNAAAPLPNLATITLNNPIARGTLATFATACTSLLSLTLTEAELPDELHSTPLRALTYLRILDSLYITADFQLARAFPVLRVLDAFVESSFEPPYVPDDEASWLHGATALEELSVGWRSYGTTDILDSQHFVALSTLPRLNRLLLYADERHIQGIASLSHLPNVTWRFGCCCAYDSVVRAFSRVDPPEQLLYVTMDFLSDEIEEASNPMARPPSPCADRICNGQDLVRAAQAAVSWLLRAPALTRVVWVTDSQGCASLDDGSLYALAAHPCITHIHVHGPSKTTPRMLQHVECMHSHKGLTVLCM